MLKIEPTHKGDAYVRAAMAKHYSKPGGFVGRQILYAVCYAAERYGVIAAGSATRHLPGRSTTIVGLFPLNNIVNNTFFHIEPGAGYPCRNFAQRVVAAWRERVRIDWQARYGDFVAGFETLVELPRTGGLYRRDGWQEVGETKGYTCKRVGGVGTDSWTGKRVWDTENLRPKRVFVRHVA